MIMKSLKEQKMYVKFSNNMEVEQRGSILSGRNKIGYVRLDNQSIERNCFIGIRFVLNFVKFISFTFGDKEMISVIEAIIREVFVKLLLSSFRKLCFRAFMDLFGSKCDRLITVSCLSERDRLIVVVFCVRIECERLNVD
ncbi:hypothetical protein Tco_1427387 [Tanacetum coccineum]